MRKAFVSIILAFLVASVVPANADPAVPAWIQRYNSSLGSDDRAYHIAVDAAGDVFVAGSRNNGFTWNDILIIKYSSEGQPLWTNIYEGPEGFASELAALALDQQGNVFIGGFCKTGGSIDFLAIKYSTSGPALWTNYYDGPAHGTDRIWDIAVDSVGDLFVTGQSTASTGYADCVTIKYSNSGIPLWTNRYDGMAHRNDSGSSLVLDSAGNVVVVGGTEVSADSNDFLLLKYTSTGNAIWTNVHGLSTFSSDYANGVVVDGMDNILSIGSSRFPLYGTPITYSIIKYSAAGVALWTNLFQGPDSVAPVLVANSSDGVFVGGFATNVDGGGFSGFDTCLMAVSETGALLWSNRCEWISAIAEGSNGWVFTAGGSPYVTTAYSEAGVPLWTNRHSGTLGQYDGASALALDAGNRVFVTGTTTGEKTYGDFATIAYSGGGTPLWTNVYDGGCGNYNDIARGLAVSQDGSAVVTGSSMRLLGENNDYTTIKYSAGGVPLWTNWYSGSGGRDDLPVAVACDRVGDVIVTGQSVGNSAWFVTVKYSESGSPLWTNLYVAGFIGSPQAMAFGRDNSVFVTGYSHGGSSYYDFATLKYSADGLQQWVNRYSTSSGTSDDRAVGVAVWDNGDAVVTGYGPNTLGGVDFITLAYSSTGAPLWTNRYHVSQANNRPVGLVLDPLGNVFVTGYSWTTDTTTYDFATVKYSNAGLALWTNRYNGPASSDDRPVALAVDQDGNVFVTGYSSNHSSGYDFVTIKYSNLGDAVWTNRFDGEGHSEDRPAGIAVDEAGKVIVTGFARSASTLASTDFVTIKYSSSGDLLWTATYNGPANDYDSPMGPGCLAVGPDNAVFVTGESDGSFATARIYDFVTLKYVEVSPLHVSLLPLTSGVLSLAFTNTPGAPFSVMASTNIADPLAWWTVLGKATETAPGRFEFTDSPGSNIPQRSYRVRSP